MRNFLLSSLLVALTSAAAVSNRVSYDGYRVVRVKSSDEVKSIIADNSLATWIGAGRANGQVDVVVPPGVKAFDGLDAQVMHQDLGASIAKESDYEVYAQGSANDTWFNSYHTYADHMQFLRDLQASYPANSEIVIAGNSFQGRPITGIHFYGTGLKNTKPAVVLHSTVHAREWITTMVTEYFAYNMLSNYTMSADAKALVDKYDYYIFPVVNPDGFVYSQTTDRLWRKNRQPTVGSTCLGHDINRNWPYQWSVPDGASSDPCAADFKGVSPANAPETKVLASWMDNIGRSSNGLKLYIDVHAYSQLFMTPYGYSCSVLAANNAVLQSLAQGAIAAIRAVYGTVFRAGPICSTIYQATGTSVDYVNDVSKAQYTFTSELRDTGTFGFVLPVSQILPSGIEAYAGFRYLLLNMR
ncbi:hypothetical protein MMC16_005108 [Acarospora aff. strigata]|nr:hypothetical protein [Acarospora aff. strigata]